MATGRVQRVYRVRIALFLLCVVLVVALLSTTYQASQTLVRLDAVERERDQWQRSAEVLQFLNLKAGNVVADLGAGSGYFTLKLSPIVGARGRILALDIRRMSLFFLWIRAVLRRDQNISIIHTQPDDPDLATNSVDAVLVSNTYHELTNRKLILNALFRSLHPGGRLVILDRGPQSGNEEILGMKGHLHELPRDLAQNEIHQIGFQIIGQQDRFAADPDSEPWWLIVARKP